MNIYVAGASRERKERSKPIIKELREMGHRITYDWTIKVDMNEENSASRETLARCAMSDYLGVISANLLVLLAPAPQTISTGAWVELGFAIAKNIPVYVSGNLSGIASVGDRCIFTLMENVTHFQNDSELLDKIKAETDSSNYQKSENCAACNIPLELVWVENKLGQRCCSFECFMSITSWGSK